MKKNFFVFAAVVANSLWMQAQTSYNDSIKTINLEEVAVMAQRANQKSAVISKTMSLQEIKSQNIGNNLADLVKTLPSMITYNEGGTAVGNTYYTIRGASANRINVTLNGMPIANPESQEMYWVNLPNLSESLRSIQVQRGVGTSVSGSSSFGGNISLETNFNAEKPYAELGTAVGQYNTFVQNVSLGTGLIDNKLSFDLRFSHTKSDGYIRNGKVNHYNVNAGLSYYLKNSLFKLIYMHGIQHTGITWEGISPEDLKKYGRRYNPAGKYYDDEGNLHFYKNETDNYYSHLIQAIYSATLSREFTLNANFGYNNGSGYYENYKQGEYFENYGIGKQTIDGVAHENSDMIVRQQMKNDYYFLNSFINYHSQNLKIIAGANYGYYDGNHYGRFVWAKYNQDIPKNFEWYRNKAKKSDFNTFAKASYSLNKLLLEAELHGRFVSYKMDGEDLDLAKLNSDLYYHFFNPKFAISYLADAKNRIYSSISVANREPQREDLKESTKQSGTPIKPERLIDTEFGYAYTGENLQFSINAYYMKYHNQLVQTGQLSPVGYRFQQNVKNSYRLGLEMDANLRICNPLTIGGNLTLSRNKIKNFTAYFDVYNNPEDYEYISQTKQFFKETNIGFSPNVVGAVYARVEPLKNGYITWSGKYVGRMYYDNTSNKENQLNDYFVSDLNVSYSLKLNRVIKSIDMQFVVNNVLNKKYMGNAWTQTVYFSDLENKKVTYKGFYPQAERNFLGRIKLTF